MSDDDIEIKSMTLESSGKTLKIPEGKLDPDAPIAGLFGMVITKTKCPCCGSEDVEITGENTAEGWSRRCKSCEALWGLDTARDGHSYSFTHTGEEVRQLMDTE